MWLRHALKLLLPFIIFSACSSPDRQAVDKLNSFSYAYHYRNLDSTEYYAHEAFHKSVFQADYSGGQAEALNNLAFVSIARMRYDEANRRLDSIVSLTDNQIELLVAYVQQMRLCQRRSRNREFYDYRERALNALKRINEERELLSERERRRLDYAESELGIVTSTYYYYVGLDRQSIEALQSIASIAERDTAQLLNYRYNVGAGGIITAGTQAEINQQEFEQLMRCLLLARQYDCPYFEANALEAIAEHFSDPLCRKQLMSDNQPAVKYLNSEDVLPGMLSIQLAEEALCLFQNFGDVYQIAGAYRTLAACSRAEGNYAQALYYLEQALSDTLIYQAPDLVASIREQLSVVYAAIDDKTSSDQNRNVYLDLQEQTRQDRWLEARATQLDLTVARLNRLLIAIGFAIILLVTQTWLFFRLFPRREQRTDLHDERMEEMNEQIAAGRLHTQQGERRHAEQRAKVSLAISITPFIDRMLYEVTHQPFDKGFMQELTEKVNEQNAILTQWIQLRQGELSLHIETFPLQLIFDIVAKGGKNFQMNRVQLNIEPTELSVKADRVLTLFMLNTLTDNARKFTPQGGRVDISAREADDYVEVSVEDTGIGMDEDTLAHLFDRKPSTLNPQPSTLNPQQGHGFGLLNCKGIIEKYRKTSRLFSVCHLGAESKPGKGSRFFFRLPKGVVTLLLLFFMTTTGLNAQNAELSMASAYADSAYYSNIRSNYRLALNYADSCRLALNAYYRQQHPQSSDTLLAEGNLSVISPEIVWLRDSLRLNFDIVLRMRNESAVAALALHKWDTYHYNNRIYTQLFKELSADTQLEAYCRKMQQSQANHSVAIALLIALLVAILAAVALQVLQAMRRKARQQQEQQAEADMLADELRRVELEAARLHVSNQVLDNCLSALKHETMYFPSRIRQLADQGNLDSLTEVVAYYRELYAILLEQSMHQTRGIRLHLEPLAHHVLGDQNLIDYLFDILRRQSGQKEPLCPQFRDKDMYYVECRVPMPHLQLNEEDSRMLFMPVDQRNIPFLICRQIVRDHGEATGRRACGIWAEVNQGLTTITIILPRTTPNAVITK